MFPLHRDFAPQSPRALALPNNGQVGRPMDRLRKDTVSHQFVLPNLIVELSNDFMVAEETQSAKSTKQMTATILQKMAIPISSFMNAPSPTMTSRTKTAKTC